MYVQTILQNSTHTLDMTTGLKIAIAVVSIGVVATSGYFIFKAATDGKEKSVRDAEKEQFGSLGELMEMARKKHPKLAMWYDDLPLSNSKLIEEGYAAMSDDQRITMTKGLKKTPMSPNIEKFFNDLGYRA